MRTRPSSWRKRGSIVLIVLQFCRDSGLAINTRCRLGPLPSLSQLSTLSRTPHLAVGDARLLPSVPSVLLGEHLRLCPSVGVESRLVSLRPGFSLLGAADVPIWATALQHRAQVEAQLFHGRPAEEPVAVVDLVDA